MWSHMKFSGPLKIRSTKLYLPSLRRVVHTRERSGEVSGRESSWRVRREEGIGVVHDVCQTRSGQRPIDAMGTSYEMPATLKLQRQSNIPSGMTARFLLDARNEHC
jgi:hypothetical protein